MTSISKCVKTFIPMEILQKITVYLADDKSSLYSCVLVSRHWCVNLMEILWSKPFHLSNSPHLIDTYLSFLPETSHDQLKLEKCVGSRKNERNFMFDYPSFLRKLTIPFLCDAIEEYLRRELNMTKFLSSNVFADSITLQTQAASDLQLFLEKQNVILRELCKLIYNKANINEFKLYICTGKEEDASFFDRPEGCFALEELMKSRDCFRGLKVFEFSGKGEVLAFFAKRCKKIETLKLFPVTTSITSKIENCIDPSIQLINSQTNLQNLEIHNWVTSKITSLLQSIRSQSNSLRSIKIVNCNLYNSQPLWYLSELQNLEEITIRENRNFNERLLVPLMKAKFHNLRSFIYKYQMNEFSDGVIIREEEFIEDEVDLDEIFSSIVLNSKDNLETVIINGFKTSQSLSNTLNSLVECKHLIELDIMLEKSEELLPLLLSIIENNQSLEKLSVTSNTFNRVHDHVDVRQYLPLFARAFPQTFKSLRLFTPDWRFNTSTLKQFLRDANFRIESMCWMNHGCYLKCSEVLRQYAKLKNCKLVFEEDCEFSNYNLGPFKINVTFNF
ncbi:9733_t:CDS:1 [Funneliformis geosporum]|uniref:8118_t:CDS:1 n=1 Tax=Funneliformis geosporum TaxID=1117311 RepID=A0A9W4SJ32_9GLOM|nr:9733_t:CDS:1 [Funneliformis geosporum]CAI2171326.1 8118_t:CDS:1 [Funneliformis geosporum]